MTTNVVRLPDNTKARRLTNREIADVLASAGVYVFQTVAKTPITPRFNRADDALTVAEVEEAVEEFETKHKYKPVQVGATRDPKKIKKMYMRNIDAMWSISCGPSRIVVIDADQKDGGPEKIAAHFEKHGLPEGCVVVPTQSGGRHYYFSDPDSKFTNSAGLLKTDYGCDVRGRGGQCVAPGSIREDGKSYGTRKDLLALRDAIRDGTLPQLPDHIVELIGSAGAASKSVTETELLPIIQELQETDWPDYADLFDPDLGTYDLEALRASNPAFAEAYDNPDSDVSTARWALAQAVLKKIRMPVTHLAVLYEGWDHAGNQTDDGKGSGNYNLRDIAREWYKNQGVYQSDGAAMGAVVDPDEESEPEPRGLLSFAADIARFTDPDHIIENLCAPGQLGMIHGASNVGKTFAVIHCGETVVAGDKYFYRNVEQSGVLYCFGEGGEGFRNRLAAYRRHHSGLDNKGMIVRDGIPNLGTKLARAIKELSKAIDESNEMYAEHGMKPVKLVFLDTFAKAIAGAQENDTSVVQPILNALRKLARDKGVCIILIHHSGKDTMLGARGSSAIIADMDFNLEIVDHNEAKKRKIKGVNPGQLAIISPKMRDANKSGIHVFKLEEVELGHNKWHNPVTSMVLTPILPSDGAAMGAVTDDEEPAATADALTADQNRQDEAKRQALLVKVREAMSGVSKIVGAELQAPLAEIERKLKVLADLKKESGTNYARELKQLLFRGEPAELLDNGWLRFQPGAGRKPSCLIFTPKRNT
jgi:hypothetical protein